MDVTNAERQKRWRDKRNALARAGAAVTSKPAPNQPDKRPDILSVSLLQARWVAGAKQRLNECRTEATAATNDWVAAEIEAMRLGPDVLLDVVERAGALWAARRLASVL